MIPRKLRPAPVRVSVRPRLRRWEVAVYFWLAGMVSGMVLITVLRDVMGG